jgi:hypothetical protein
MRRALILAGAAALTAGPATAAGAPTLLHIASHLPRPARASLDGARPVITPGFGATVVAVTAGAHTLKVVTAAGATYQATLDLRPEALMRWKGRGYWCVNLLEHSLQVYSPEDCQEDVTDAG